MAFYKSYHSNLVLLYKIDALPAFYADLIPKSTLHTWKSKDLSKVIGCDILAGNDIALLKEIAKNKKLRAAAKALYYLLTAISKLFTDCTNKAELLRNNKLMVLETVNRTKIVLGNKRVLAYFGLSASKLYYWIERKTCHQSVLQLCSTRHSSQLLPNEVKSISEYLNKTNYAGWSLLSIYYQALKEKAVFMGIGTWYKYAHRLGVKKRFIKPKPSSTIGIRASNILDMLHMDVTIFKPTDQVRVYIYFIVDNYSRTILGYKASLSYSSSISLALLKATILNHSLKKDFKLITDGGSENLGVLSKYADGNETIEKLIAQKDIIQSNSMVEAVNKHMKYHYLFRNDTQNFDGVCDCLSKTVSEYNNKPHGALYGLSPNEVLSGAKPSSKRFSVEKEAARKQRILTNMSNDCCD